MLDEEMDNIIRQAAEQHHPSYDNKAWDKMEQLLDQHLPQSKDRRGFAFFLVLALLIGGGLFVAGYYFVGNKKEKVASVESKKAEDRTPVKTITPGNNSTAEQNGSSVTNTNDNTNPDSKSTVQNGSPVANPNGNTNPGSKSPSIQHASSLINTNDNSNKTAQLGKPRVNTFAKGRTAAKTNMNITPGNAVADESSVKAGSPKNDKLNRKAIHLIME